MMRFGFGKVPALGLIAAMLAGCGADRSPAPARADRTLARPSENQYADPCANRLHDLSGALLLYYAQHQALPTKIEQLGPAPGGGAWVCPVSKKPYIYNPDGILDQTHHTRTIIYDAEPSHGGLRWGITIVEPRENQALIATVVRLAQ